MNMPPDSITVLFRWMRLGRAKPAKTKCSHVRCTQPPTHLYLSQPGRHRSFPTARCDDHQLPEKYERAYIQAVSQ